MENPESSKLTHKVELNNWSISWGHCHNSFIIVTAWNQMLWNVVMLQSTFWIRNITIWLFCIIRCVNGFWGVISAWKQQTQHCHADLWRMIQWQNFICSHYLSVFFSITQLWNTKYSKAEWAGIKRLMPTSPAKPRPLQTKQLLFTHTNMTFSLCGAEKEAAGAWNLHRLAFFKF